MLLIKYIPTYLFFVHLLDPSTSDTTVLKAWMIIEL